MQIAECRGVACWVSEARYKKGYGWGEPLQYLSLVGARVAVRSLWARLHPSRKERADTLTIEDGTKVRFEQMDDDPVLKVSAPYGTDLVHLVMMRTSMTTRWAFSQDYFTHRGAQGEAWLRRLSAHTGIPFRKEWLQSLIEIGLENDLISLYDGFGDPLTRTSAVPIEWEALVVDALEKGTLK